MQENKSKRVVIARLTAIRAVGVRTIIEVQSDATFSSFYHYHTQEGNRRSTKKEIRSANRNDSLPYVNAHTYTPGLEVIKTRLEAMKQFTSVKVRVIKPRAYKQLINAAADQLGKGLPKINTVDLSSRKPNAFQPRNTKAIPVSAWLKRMQEQPVTS